MKYVDYVAAEEEAGREPLPMGQWRMLRAREAQQRKTEAAEKGFDTGTAPIADPAPPENPDELEDDSALDLLPTDTAPPEPTIDELERYAESLKHGVPHVAPISHNQQVPDITGIEDGALVFHCHENRWRVEVMQGGQKVLDNRGSSVILPHRQIEFQDWNWTADMANPDQREKALWLVRSDAWRKGEITLVNRPAGMRPISVTTGPRTSGAPRVQNIDRPAGALSARLE